MADLDVETYIAPPEPDEDEGGGSDSTRLTVHFMAVDDHHYDAAVQLFGTDCSDPEKIAEGLLRTALAVAHLIGPDVAWAAMRRFTSYDGGMS
jgi:hypothetical protein